jgi:hypothetical protein
MSLVDLSKPGEKKKLIWAGALGLVSIIVLWWTFIGFENAPKTAATHRNSDSAKSRTAKPATPSQRYCFA